MTSLYKALKRKRDGRLKTEKCLFGELCWLEGARGNFLGDDPNMAAAAADVILRHNHIQEQSRDHRSQHLFLKVKADKLDCIVIFKVLLVKKKKITINKIKRKMTNWEMDGL